MTLNKAKKAFSLVELLVVVSIAAVTMAILVPALASVRSQSRAVVCRSNLRQLLLAGIGYAYENDGFYVPAAADLWDNAGLCRWHGRRQSLKEPFDATKGPLASYLADGRVKNCPAKVPFVRGLDWDTNFEQGCGGYGYNLTYLGSRIWEKGIDNPAKLKAAYARTTNVTEVGNPARTLMFADTAMSKDGRTLIEYSFAEPPFAVWDGQPIQGFYMSPSIHFRHHHTANIGWADGHVDKEPMASFDGDNAYGVRSADVLLGWFEPVDNTPFDLQ